MTRDRIGNALGWLALATFAGGLVGGLLAVVSVGLTTGYYLTEPLARADHPWHESLRSGGTLGVLTGTVGATLMSLMLLYSVRKLGGRFLWFLGPLHWWLRFHIASGILGPMYIVVHTSFLWPRHLIGIGFWCMLGVALSGVFGRYVYGHFLRSAAGRELDWRSARGELQALRAQLVSETASASAAPIGAAVALVEEFERDAAGLFDLFRVDLEVQSRIGLLDAHLHRAGLAGPTLRRARGLLGGQLRLKRNLEALKVTKRLFRWWHLFHNPLARAMYLIAGLHVLEALLFGGALAQLWSLVGG